MASRKDNKGYVLKSGESQRKDGSYQYRYTDNNGNRKYIYAKKLQELREKEENLKKDIIDCIDTAEAQRMTVDEAFKKYIAGKSKLREQTKSNYLYLYDKCIKNRIGSAKVKNIKYSDIKKLFNELMEGMTFGSVEIVYNFLHPMFDMCVRDDLIRKNPTDNVLKDLRDTHETKAEKRIAMSESEQKRFMEFLKEDDIYSFYYNLFVVFLGTGGRAGEILGLTWKDIDFKNNLIHINHTLTYKYDSDMKIAFRISPTKTNAGSRDIPMLTEVRQALIREREKQLMLGGSKAVIDGYKDFVFTNTRNNVNKPNTINRVMYGVIDKINKIETAEAKKQRRDPDLIRHFSLHNLRHTFATNLCMNETNLKVIQEIMGHSSIKITMDIYAECTEKQKNNTFERLDGVLKIG